MLTAYLIIAHLTADFILQPTKLIEWKTKNPIGILVHVLIFIILAALFLFPYLTHPITWIVLAAIGVIHFITDQIKIKTSENEKSYSMPFLLDQAVHLLSLIFGGQILRIYLPHLNYISLNTVIAIIGCIYILYVFFIYFLQKSKTRKLKHVKLVTYTITIFFYILAAILF